MAAISCSTYLHALTVMACETAGSVDEEMNQHDDSLAARFDTPGGGCLEKSQFLMPPCLAPFGQILDF